MKENPGLPTPLLRFIASDIPTYQSAEVLVFLANRSERAWKPEEIAAEMRPVVVALPLINEYLALFRHRGIVEESDGCYRCNPASRELEAEIGALAHAYNERPVTLILTIYGIAKSRIQSFAYSVKFRKE